MVVWQRVVNARPSACAFNPFSWLTSTAIIIMITFFSKVAASLRMTLASPCCNGLVLTASISIFFDGSPSQPNILSWMHQLQLPLMAVRPSQNTLTTDISYVHETVQGRREVVSSKTHISAWANTQPSYVNNYLSCSSHFLPCIPIEVRKNNMIHDHR